MAGFTKPTTTPTPDALFDYWLVRLAGAELRVLLYAVRRTFGFGKEADTISLEQFLHGITTHEGQVRDLGTGIRSRSTLAIAIRKVSEKGLLIKEKRSHPSAGDQASSYRLVITEYPTERAATGFRPVNTTPVPDELFDYWLAQLSDAELFVLLYIVRRTLGFRKNADTISLRQFRDGVTTRDGRVLDYGCGVRSHTYLYRALGGLEEKGLIVAERRLHAVRGNIPTRYHLVFEGDMPRALLPDPRADAEADDALTQSVGVPSSMPVTRTDGTDEGGAIGEQRGVRLVNGGSDAAEAKGSAISEQRQVRLVNRGGAIPARRLMSVSARPSGTQSHPQQTGQQETENQETDHSTFREASPSRAMPSRGTTRSSVEEVAPHYSSQRRTDTSVSARGRSQMRLEPEYQTLLPLIIDFGRELGDEATPRASTTRAYRLMRDADVTVDDVVPLLYEARALTRAYQASVTKTRADSSRLPRKNLMPYFFSVLESLLHPELHPAPQREEQVPEVEAPLPLAEGPAVTQTPAVPQAHPVWRAALEELRRLMTPENYLAWLAETHVVGQHGALLRVGVPTSFAKEWLQHKLHHRILHVLQHLDYDGLAYTGMPIDAIEYVVIAGDDVSGEES